MNIIYIHGFRSSGDSSKAALLRKRYPEINTISPTFSANPREVIEHLTGILENLEGKTLLLGTSLGGFYSLYFACCHGYTCCAINPAWQPQVTLKRKIGTYKRYDSDDLYDFRPEYIGIMEELVEEIKSSKQIKERINFFLSTDDEELSFDDMDSVFPVYCVKKWFDNSGHRFSRFEEILVEIRSVLGQMDD
jgi:predicted esterase YcpF (UPF0227 family)